MSGLLAPQESPSSTSRPLTDRFLHMIKTSPSWQAHCSISGPHIRAAWGFDSPPVVWFARQPFNRPVHAPGEFVDVLAVDQSDAAEHQLAGADQAAVTLGNTDGEIGGLTISYPPTQAEVQALRDKCEELADDVRNLSTLIHALRTALVSVGAIKGPG
jgi:hypothetical protein